MRSTSSSTAPAAPACCATSSFRSWGARHHGAAGIAVDVPALEALENDFDTQVRQAQQDAWDAIGNLLCTCFDSYVLLFVY